MIYPHSLRHPLFRRRWFTDEVIITCVRWYLRFKLSYRDLAELARELGVSNGVIVEKPDLMGLRDRALIGLMAYSFVRVGVVLQMKVVDGGEVWIG